MANYDGLLIRCDDGLAMRIVDPPTWRIDRWLGWWLGYALMRCASVVGVRMRLRAWVEVVRLTRQGQRLPTRMCRALEVA